MSDDTELYFYIYAYHRCVHLYTKRQTHAGVFTAALLSLAIGWVQGFIINVEYTYTIVYYMAMKITALKLPWVTLPDMLLSERSRIQRSTRCVLPLI